MMTAVLTLLRTILFGVCALLFFTGISPSETVAQEKHPILFQDVPLPKSLTLCGEPMPLENPYVLEMLDRELTIAAWDRGQVFMWLKRAGRYFPHIERRLREAGMPDDLKYLAVAESALLTHIRSRKGALGTWQFLAPTARRNGLRKDRAMDERRSFERSTEAALKYLKTMKETFGSWSLAMAAYNCGEARLKKEIKIQRVRDYYRLNLPLETERYVFRIAAAKLIMEDPGTYGYALPEERVYKPLSVDIIEVRIRAPVPIAEAAQKMGTDYKVIKELNPQIRGYYFPVGRYSIRVPSGMGPNMAAILNQSPSKASPRPPSEPDDNRYEVRQGDTLSHISQRTGISVETLKALNGLEDSTIQIGQQLQLSP